MENKNKERDNLKEQGVEETHDLVAESFMEGTVEDKLDQNISNKQGGKSNEQK